MQAIKVNLKRIDDGKQWLGFLVKMPESGERLALYPDSKLVWPMLITSTIQSANSSGLVKTKNSIYQIEVKQ